MLEMPSTESEINFDFLGAPHAPVLILSNGAKTRKSFKPNCVGDSGNIKTGVRGAVIEVNFGPCWSTL